MRYLLLGLLLLIVFPFDANATCFDLSIIKDGVRIGRCPIESANDIPVTTLFIIWMLINTTFAQLLFSQKCHLIIKCILFILALPLSPLVLCLSYFTLAIYKKVPEIVHKKKVPQIPTTTPVKIDKSEVLKTQLFIGDFRFNSTEQSLSNSKQNTLLEPKCMQVLSYLIEHQPRIVSLEELHTNIWKNQIVTDTAVRRVISKLRVAFSDTDTKNPKYIKSVMKRGYQLTAEVKQQPTE